MSYYDINLSQINKMKHAIGIDRDRIKSYKYKAYRNYYCTYRKDSEWDMLVDLKLAEIKKYKNDAYYYYVSRAGLNLLEQITFIKIVQGN